MLESQETAKAIEIFYMIGINPAGLLEDDIISIYEAAQETKENINNWV